ncbi:hypothetical protein SLA_5675 [Streptomyces laurentii]|uniref:Uncharacterized protein n=1 Tax=Streptomyces laurentii TaxID=39478 RepID=A0A160P5N6_STRLU|nr:hypothetical protein SLA_5675 [Streptomyces laurentii]
MTGDWREDRIGSALRGENPTVLRRLDVGFAVIGDVQFLPGYAVLPADEPDVRRLVGSATAEAEGHRHRTGRTDRCRDPCPCPCPCP